MLYQFKQAQPDLFRALKENKSDQVWRIVNQENYNANFQDESGQILLHIAAYYNCCEQIIQALIDKTTNINLSDSKGNTPLHVAATRGSYSAIISLLNAGVDRTLVNKDGETPAQSADKNDRFSIGELISNFGKKELSGGVAAPVADEIPDEYLCQITYEIMKDPVITPAGNTYDREAIVNWINKNHNEPKSRKPLTVDQLTPNLSIKSLIENWEKERSIVGKKRTINVI